MFRNDSASVHQFAMVPKSDVPRSVFQRDKTYKTAFDAGYLVPFYLAEILPGDSFKVDCTMFGRLATQLFPYMDNLWLETFFFFVPNRITWSHWINLMGEQASPADSIAYTVPQIVSKAAGYDINSVFDYLGLPTAGTPAITGTYSHSALPLRAYNKIYQDWFKDENLQNAVALNLGDGPDLYTDYPLLRRGKRHDYFTSALPWPQKGNTAVTLPLSGNAPVKGLSVIGGTANSASGATSWETGGSSVAGTVRTWPTGATVLVTDVINSAGSAGVANHFPNVYADLSAATASTINAIRTAVTIQQYLEKSARGGSRYVETIQVMFGVRPPDYRLQRAEYLGGGSTRINNTPIAQTSGTSASGTTTPLGNLAGMATYLIEGHGFSQSFVEHGYVMGIVSVRADLTYQQGMQKHWSRSTLYDFYNPVFANLGEQTVLNKEIYLDGSANDALAFGYQERWSEYRYDPNQITGRMRSTAASTIDAWHLAQKFASLPTLNSTFIQETPPLSRVVAVGAAADGQQLLLDALIKQRCVRPLPRFSVPGLLRF